MFGFVNRWSMLFVAVMAGAAFAMNQLLGYGAASPEFWVWLCLMQAAYFLGSAANK